MCQCQKAYDILNVITQSMAVSVNWGSFFCVGAYDDVQDRRLGRTLLAVCVLGLQAIQAAAPSGDSHGIFGTPSGSLSCRPGI